MKTKIKRLLFTLFSAVLICGTAFGENVYAAEEDMHDYEVDGDGVFYYTKDAAAALESDNTEDMLVLNSGISTMSLGETEDGSIIFTTFEDLKELAGESYTSATPAYYTAEEALVIQEDLTIPAYLYVEAVSQQVIIPEGVTLTMTTRSHFSADQLDINGTYVSNKNGGLQIYSALNITGICEQAGYINLASGSTMNVADTGSYSGSGYINVYCSEEEIPSVVLGVDLTNFETTYISNYEYWRLRDISGMIRLGNPTNLEWGYEHTMVWNSETQTNEWIATEKPGKISWKPAEPDQGKVWVNICRASDDTICESWTHTFGSSSIPEWRNVDDFRMSDLESGEYYFTIVSVGDNTTYLNSDKIQSETWNYIKPSKQLGACNGLSWDWPQVKWEIPEDDECGGYEVEFYYACDESETPDIIGGTSSYSDSTSTKFRDSMIQRYGNGYYYFKVRTLSDDIAVACNGVWSELSKPYIVTELSQSVVTELNTIIDTAATADEAREAIQSMDTEELKSAMLADQSNTGTLDKITQLEEVVGGSASIEVSDDVTAFDQNKISVIGANLNNAASEEEPVALVIDKPKKEDVIPAAYDNSVAVRFSMTLENVADPENLEVPVKITLPVPSTINPEFLVILHYHAATGEVEELNPYVYSENGQYYASFVLTSFSDFVMTQTAQPIKFEDVVAGSYYEQPVQWAVNRGITNGYGSDTTFNPDGTCTRGQIVTFLWRANGSPEPASMTNPFTDVASDAYYYKAVLWAVENGITAGYGSDTIFNPDGACTRGQVATFLWRAEGKPGMSHATNPFTDVKPGEFYYDAVLWAVENGITNGYGSDTIFNPNGDCTRGQIVTFLYRAMN